MVAGEFDLLKCGGYLKVFHDAKAEDLFNCAGSR
jgi:hypothetical protein